MPAFDLRYLQVAEYKKKSGGGTEYGTPVSMGDAMTVALEMRFAEGRLYAESALAEYMKKATGGTATAGVKYIPLDAQKLLFRAYEKQRTVSSAAVKSVAFGKKSTGQYVAPLPCRASRPPEDRRCRQRGTRRSWSGSGR